MWIQATIAGTMATVMFALSALPHFPAERADTWYTVQVLATSPENRPALLSIYESLREEGHLVYHGPTRVGGRSYLRLRAGIFDERDQAQAYAREIRTTRRFDGFVAKAEVGVARCGDRFRLVTTPSGIWRATAASAKLLYAPADGSIDMEHTAPQISPDGAAIVFYADHRIVRVTLDTGVMQILRQGSPEGEELLNSVVRWSPDGRYLAYLDAVDWELPTKLWILRSDGSGHHCLFADETGQTKAKSFQWHPRANRVFCVIGPTHGTVSLGGSLCCIGLDGRRTKIVAADLAGGTEVLSEFRITRDLLQYRIVRHDADGADPQYALYERTLDDLN